MGNPRKTAIVTGASQGIGAGIVKGFVERGFNVVASSRNVTKSTEVMASNYVALVDGDIGDPATDQARVLIDAKVPVFSFIFGIPPKEILDACRDRGIVKIGTAATPDEAIELQKANVDAIVASGFEAGGHRGSFLRAAEDSLTGTFSLVPQVADLVSVPVVAAGGIADARGIVAALALGAQGVQIGTAFLACEESGASPAHREALLSGNASHTALTAGGALAQTPDPSKDSAMSHQILYRTIKIEGLSIFYREAGPKDAPTLLLLHGLPSSSRMFEPLFTRLAGQFHMIAPDYPGFGHSDAPSPKAFSYTFDNIAKVMEHLTEAMSLTKYTLYMQDYGGPVGFRMVLAHPERVEALIVQDAVAHYTGLGANWKTRRAFWADRPAYEAELRKNLLSLETTRTRHVGSDPNPERYDPDFWTDEYALLNRPGEADIQSDLFYDYRINVEAYPKWQAWMQKNQPRLLVLWGRYESSFDPSEPESYRRDVPKAEVHILDGGHFALETAADEIADLVRRFMSGEH
jgi:pimeloyl-ACP methyl ester carboxylesterase